MARLSEWEVRAEARTSLTEDQMDALGEVLATWHGAANYIVATKRLTLASTVWGMDAISALNRVSGGIRAWARRQSIDLTSMRFDVRLVK